MSSQNRLSMEDYVVKEFTSTKGARFAVAYPKVGGYTVENLDGNEVRTAVSDDSWIDVNWPLGFSQSGLSLGQEVVDLGIDFAQVQTYSIIWKYELFFTNTQGWGFQFKDATNDIYSVSTILNGTHYLLYNSDIPTIIGVK